MKDEWSPLGGFTNMYDAHVYSRGGPWLCAQMKKRDNETAIETTECAMNQESEDESLSLGSLFN